MRAPIPPIVNSTPTTAPTQHGKGNLVLKEVVSSCLWLAIMIVMLRFIVSVLLGSAIRQAFSGSARQRPLRWRSVSLARRTDTTPDGL